MKYTLLIYDRENFWVNLSEQEQQSVIKEYGQFTEQIKASGHWVAGFQLYPTAAASSVRVRDGKSHVSDGPFAATAEQLGGYYLIEAKDQNEANDLAARVPSARFGTVEVRPVVERPAAASPTATATAAAKA
jgi:hypothetical protein